jgi:hypothetical protein
MLMLFLGTEVKAKIFIGEDFDRGNELFLENLLFPDFAEPRMSHDLSDPIKRAKPKFRLLMEQSPYE